MTAEHWLSEDEKKAVEAAIRQAEEKTCAEFVCLVATDSGRYDRAESLVGLAFAILGLFVAQLAGGLWRTSEVGSFAPHGMLGEGWMVLGIFLGFLFGVFLAERVPEFKRPLVPGREMDQEVERSSLFAFALNRVSHTGSRVGVLVYLSLFERRVVVLADQAAFATLGEEGVNKLRDTAQRKLREGQRSEALIATVEAASTALAEAHPRAEDDQDELPNHLIIIHPRP